MKRTILFMIFFTSCSKTLEKEVIFDDFNNENRVVIEIPEEYSVSNVNVYFSGETSDTIYFSSLNNDTIFRFRHSIGKELKLFQDFYGGQYELISLPSSAKGRIKIKIHIPYSY